VVKSVSLQINNRTLNLAPNANRSTVSQKATKPRQRGKCCFFQQLFQCHRVITQI